MRLLSCSLLVCACVPATQTAVDPKAGDTDTPDTDSTATDTDPALADFDCAPGAYPTPAEDPDACTVTPLSCGDVWQGTTVGGSSRFGYDTWQGAQCLDYLLGEVGSLAGTERLFELTVAEGQGAVVRLLSPCARHDLRAVATSETCNDSPATCVTASGDFSVAEVDLRGTLGGRRWEIIVDGYDGEQGNFQLTVTCTGG